MPNRCPSNAHMAQAMKDIPVHKVFPLRTAPSQMIASRLLSEELGVHQVSTFRCFGEKVSNCTFVSFCLLGSGVQSLKKGLRLSGL